MKKILFVGSECVPFIKTGGLADVMGSLPKALNEQGCDVRVAMPFYKCIPEKYRSQAEYLTHFQMDIGPNMYYVGVMTLKWDGVTYYFIDNEEFFSDGDPYTDMARDIGKFAYFDKAVLSALSVIGFLPEIIHCHDWQASLIPVYLRTLFADTRMARHAKCVMTIHNMRFQGVHNIEVMQRVTGLPSDVFTPDRMEFHEDANMLKGGLVYADKISTVSNNYAGEIKTFEYGEGLAGVMSFYHWKLCGIVNGIDWEMYNPATDEEIYKTYTTATATKGKAENKRRLQEEWGLEQAPDKLMIGLVSRLTDQKGLDLVSAIMDRLIDGNTQFVLIGTGEDRYENLFRDLENRYKGQVCANIMYSDERAHKLYAAADAMLVPSRFEPCGLTQLIAMRYGAIPVVRETGGLKDTVMPYNEFDQSGTGFSFDLYNADIFLDILNYAKTVYFTQKKEWAGLVKRAMEADFSWKNSAKQYVEMYDELLQ